MIFTKNHEVGIILFGTDTTKEGQAICEWDL